MKRGNRGYTLIELVVAAAVMTITITFLLNSLTTQKKNYSVTDEVVELQQSLRVIGDVLERDIRHAGFMVPEGGAACAIDRTNAPDTLYLSDEMAVDPSMENRSDLSARIQGGANNVAAGSQTVNVDTIVLEIVDPDPAYDRNADGVNDSDYRVGAGVIVVDAANPIRGAACGVLEAIPSATQLQFNIQSAPLAAVPVGGAPVDLAVVPARTYQIDANLRLLRDGMVIASNVEDLQAAFFVDDNANGLVDPGEYRGDGAGADFDPSNNVDLALLREIRVNVVLRTRTPDPENTQGMFQALENRAPIAGADGLRRRVYISTVMLRNVGERPS